MPYDVCSSNWEIGTGKRYETMQHINNTNEDDACIIKALRYTTGARICVCVAAAPCTIVQHWTAHDIHQRIPEPNVLGTHVKLREQPVGELDFSVGQIL